MVFIIFYEKTSAMAEEPCQKSLLDVHSVRGLRDHNTLPSVNDLISDFFPSMSWKAVHEHGIRAVYH
jgi:hypothetical protein